MPELEEVATIWTEPVYWTFSRPFELFQMKEIVENAYSTDETTAFLHVFVSSYHENDVWYPPFFGRDGLVFTIGINVTGKDNFVSSVLIHLQPDHNSTLYVDNDFLEYANLTVRHMDDVTAYPDEAFIECVNMKLPSYLKAVAYFVFDDSNSLDHQLSLNLEIMYLKKDNPQKVIIPMVLRIPLPPNYSGE